MSREEIRDAISRLMPAHEAEVELAEYEASIRMKALGEAAKELYRAAQRERGDYTRHAPGLKHGAHLIRAIIEGDVR